jgi:hypothetical protein
MNDMDKAIETPSTPHECRCYEAGADGTREHYIIVADIEVKRKWADKSIPVCVNHIGNYAKFPDTYKITVRPKYADNPRLGYCAYCKTSIWASNATIQDATGFYHTDCRVAARVRDLEKWERVALEALNTIRDLKGPEFILGDAVNVARWALANRTNPK